MTTTASHETPAQRRRRGKKANHRRAHGAPQPKATAATPEKKAQRYLTVFAAIKLANRARNRQARATRRLARQRAA